MKLSLGFSPCPNDTFIFDALIHHKVDTEGLEFDVYYEDVETLNQKAFRCELDITKLSYHAYAYAIADYVLLNAGSALGFGVGPLLICKDPELGAQLSVISSQLPAAGVRSLAPTWPSMPLASRVANLKIGIPGQYTTANFLLSLAFPELADKQEIVFSAIEQALLDGSIDLGLIIHENRFTYESKGLHKVVDLGDYWEKTTHSPIPLGGIVARRELSDEMKHKIDRVIRRSVEFAFKNPKSGIDFIRSHAQEMNDAVMYKHIELYVNRFSVSLGDEGRSAIRTLFERAWALGAVKKTSNELFL